ncbi:MAG: alpha/beta fold hydrolase [Acidimicrobiia bacterium]
MRFRPLLAVVTIVVAACSGTGGDAPTGIHLQGSYRDGSGVEMRYLVWLPDGYGDDRQALHPMIVFLHGSGSETYDSEFVIGMGLPAVLASGDQPADFDFVVISPQAAPGSSWGMGDQLDVVDHLVAEAADTYLVDPKRVYLTGLSMGGYAAWHLATRHPDRYAAMVSVSGSGYQLQTLPPADYSCRLTAVPVWGIHGEQDLIAAYDPVHAQVEAWEDLCGTGVEWTSYQDAGHIETIERAYRDPALYHWMTEQANS